jgi:hypothetical protein
VLPARHPAGITAHNCDIGSWATKRREPTVWNGRLPEQQARAALDTAHGAFHADSQSAVGFVEDDVGERAGGVFIGQQVCGAADIAGHAAGGAGEEQRDLLEVCVRQAGIAGPAEHGLDQALVGSPVERELRFEVSFGIVQDQVCAAHRCLAVSSRPSALSSGSWVVWARKRA